MNIRPATTGETENGRSMSVVSRDLPRNSNLAMAQAAATPNNTLSGTLMAATVRVRRMADHESGSVNEFQYAGSPLEKACANTFTSGSNRNTAEKTSAIAMSVHLIRGGYSVPRCDWTRPVRRGR